MNSQLLTPLGVLKQARINKYYFCLGNDMLRNMGGLYHGWNRRRVSNCADPTIKKGSEFDRSYFR